MVFKGFSAFRAMQSCSRLNIAAHDRQTVATQETDGAAQCASSA